MFHFKWVKLKSIRRAHTWFRDENSGKIAACDESGILPPYCHDGTLWLDQSKPIILADNHGSISAVAPVISGRTGAPSSILCNIEKMLYLMQEHCMTLEAHGVELAALATVV